MFILFCKPGLATEEGVKSLKKHKVSIDLLASPNMM